jgi:hypothetical protein
LSSATVDDLTRTYARYVPDSRFALSSKLHENKSALLNMGQDVDVNKRDLLREQIFSGVTPSEIASEIRPDRVKDMYRQATQQLKDRS